MHVYQLQSGGMKKKQKITLVHCSDFSEQTNHYLLKFDVFFSSKIVGTNKCKLWKYKIYLIELAFLIRYQSWNNLSWPYVGMETRWPSSGRNTVNFRLDSVVHFFRSRSTIDALLIDLKINEKNKTKFLFIITPNSNFRIYQTYVKKG